MFDNENFNPFEENTPEKREEHTAPDAQNESAQQPADAEPQQPVGPEIPPVEPRPQFAYQQFYTNPQPPKKKGGIGKWIAVAAICALLGSAIGAVGVGGAFYLKDRQTDVSDAQHAVVKGQEENAPAETEDGVNYVSTSITVNRNDDGSVLTPAEIYEKYADAVVIVSLEGTTTNIWGQISKTAGTGSGFVLTEDGYIVTNYHVIENATKITVTTDDDKEYPATVVGFDEDNDVALIKIDATGLTTVSIGDSDTIRVGEQVAAIGNPLGELTNTMTVGYLSAKEREVNESANSTPINMLQTDVAINGGNSGGPLFDMHGNVIGITTAKYTGSAIEGLSFAIPINDAMEIVNSILQYGYVTGKPYMGVQIASNAAVYGAMIASVEPDSAAQKAGLRENDIITGIDGEKINSYNDLVSALRDYRAGDTASIEIYRDGAYKTLQITFDERPQETAEEQPTQQEENSSERSPFINDSPFGAFGG